MKITKLTLDNEDIKEAVRLFLATKGITTPINSVLKEYSWSDHEIVFDFEVDKTQVPAAKVVKAAEPVVPASSPISVTNEEF